MMAVLHPACARAVESGPPAWPAPITIASYCAVVVMYFLILFIQPTTKKSLAQLSGEGILACDSLANDERMDIVSALVCIDRLEVVGVAADRILQSDTISAQD